MITSAVAEYLQSAFTDCVNKKRIMKKLLGIMVLGLLLSGNADAALFKKSYEKAIKKGKLNIGMTQNKLLHLVKFNIWVTHSLYPKYFKSGIQIEQLKIR